jgi:hypothetical protein
MGILLEGNFENSETDWDDIIRNQHSLDEPSFEELEDWMMDSGCEAACEHACWIEHDGYCLHGKPSWFIKLGLI